MQWLEHRAEARTYEASCVTLAKFFNLSVPQWLHLQNRDSNGMDLIDLQSVVTSYNLKSAYNSAWHITAAM